MSPRSSWPNVVIRESWSRLIGRGRRGWGRCLRGGSVHRVRPTRAPVVLRRGGAGRRVVLRWSRRVMQHRHRIGHVRGAQLGAAGGARETEELVGFLLDDGADPGAEVGCERRVEDEVPVGVGVGVRAARVVQPARTRGVVRRARIVVSRHWSRTVRNVAPSRTVSSRRSSDAGSTLADAAISDAWASDSSPDRNAFAVSGSSSSFRAVSSSRPASPTLTPVAEASHSAELRCPECFQFTPRATRPAASERPATANRSQRVNRSTNFFAPSTSSASASNSAATSPRSRSADRTCSNTLVLEHTRRHRTPPRLRTRHRPRGSGEVLPTTVHELMFPCKRIHGFLQNIRYLREQRFVVLVRLAGASDCSDGRT